MAHRIALPALLVALGAPQAVASTVVGGVTATATGSISASIAVGPPAPPPITFSSPPVVVSPAPAPVVVSSPPVIVTPAPAPVVVTPAPPPTVVVTPVTPVAPVPTTIRLTPGRGLITAPAPTVVAPACSVCECPDPCDGSDDWDEDDSIDLNVYGSFRYIYEGGELGGFHAALRLLVTDEISLETTVGYLAGGTESGGNREEAPIAANVLWYPWDRDSPLYLGIGLTTTWAGVWDETILPLTGAGWGETRDLWFVGGRLVLGAEIELFDFLLVTGETEVFGRTVVDDSVCGNGPGSPECTEFGFAVNLGMGLRF